MPQQSTPPVPAHPLGQFRRRLAIFSAYQRNARLLLYANLCINTGVGVFGVVYNLYLVALGYNLQVVGLLSAVNTLTTGVASLTISSLLHRYPMRNIMMIGSVLLTFGSLGAAFITPLPLLIAFSMCSGMGVALSNTPASLVMMENSTAADRSQLFSAFFAVFTGGATLGGLLSGIIPGLLAPLPLFHSQGLGTFRATMLVAVILLSVALPFFSRMAAPEPRSPAQATDTPTSILHRMRINPYRDLTVILAAVLLLSCSLGIVVPFFNLYFAEVLHASASQVGFIFSAASIAATIFTFSAPALANRMGKLRAFVAMRLVSVPVLIILVFHAPLLLAAALFVLRNVTGNISGSLDNNFMMDTLPPSVRAVAASGRSSVFNIAWAVSSFIGGALILAVGYSPLFVISAVMTVLSLIVYFGYFAATDGDDFVHKRRLARLPKAPLPAPYNPGEKK